MTEVFSEMLKKIYIPGLCELHNSPALEFSEEIYLVSRMRPEGGIPYLVFAPTTFSQNLGSYQFFPAKMTLAHTLCYCCTRIRI